MVNVVLQQLDYNNTISNPLYSRTLFTSCIQRTIDDDDDDDDDRLVDVFVALLQTLLPVRNAILTAFVCVFESFTFGFQL